MNAVVDDTGYYALAQSQQQQQYVPTGFQDRYYPINTAPVQPPPPSQPQQQHAGPPPLHLPSPPPAPQASHPTSINSLLSHDTPPQQQQSRPHTHHHPHHHHHHTHHHHHAPTSSSASATAQQIPRPSSGSMFYAPNRLPPLPGSRMNHLVDPSDRDRLKLEPTTRRDGYF